jgi:putative transcriptional regulator
MKKSPQSSPLLFNCVGKTRNSIGFTQAVLAERAGITRGNLNKIEKGQVIPSVLTALRIANSLQTNASNLFSPEHLLTADEKLDQELKALLGENRRFYED